MVYRSAILSRNISILELHTEALNIVAHIPQFAAASRCRFEFKVWFPRNLLGTPGVPRFAGVNHTSGSVGLHPGFEA
jgi:hypothetical protein